jgi:hypothetical protein
MNNNTKARINRVLESIRLNIDNFEEGLVSEKEMLGNIAIIVSQRYDECFCADDKPAIPFQSDG